MASVTFKPGDAFLASDFLASPYRAVFEDDGETGYFYAYEPSGEKNDVPILDAVHIYNVANVTDRDRESVAMIVWDGSGMRCALLINDYPHAVFDFEKREGYCRENFPNFEDRDGRRWRRSDHSWSDEAILWLS